MKPSGIASRVRMDLRRFGVFRTAYMLFMKGVNLIVDLRLIRVFKSDVVDPSFLECNEPIQWRFLDESEIRKLVRDGMHTEEFEQTALDKGDECYGGFDGDVLIGHGWYSNKPTDDEGLTFHFGSSYMYQYAAATHPQYRGRRLSPIRGTRARREHLWRGFQGTVFTIDSHNFPALRAMVASGFQDIGYFTVLKIGRQAWIHTSRGCREHGFSLAKPTETMELASTNS